jgi:hypothetical protein
MVAGKNGGQNHVCILSNMGRLPKHRTKIWKKGVPPVHCCLEWCGRPDSIQQENAGQKRKWCASAGKQSLTLASGARLAHTATLARDAGQVAYGAVGALRGR